MQYQINRYSNFLVEVVTDLPVQMAKSPSPIELIGLLFTLRYRRSRFDVSKNGERRLAWERDGLKIPLCDHQFRSEIFNRGDDSLSRYLSCSFESFKEGIEAELIADTLIKQWIEIRDEENSRSSDRVFSMTMNLKLWLIEARHEIGVVVIGEDCGMIPACGEAVTKMLKRLEIEEDNEVCVVYLEELKKQKKKNGECALQMPCLHLFHENCIEEWLKKSNFCPICRFEMPIPELI